MECILASTRRPDNALLFCQWERIFWDYIPQTLIIHISTLIEPLFYDQFLHPNVNYSNYNQKNIQKQAWKYLAGLGKHNIE